MEITLTAEQVEQMLKTYKLAEKRWERARERGNTDMAKYEWELLAIERMLDIAGIEY